MNEDLILTLQNYWFSEKEAKIYLTALSLWVAPASTIARNANESRTTVYSLLKEMLKKWYISEVENSWVLQYSPVSPEIILSNIEKKYLNFKELLPSLLSIIKNTWNKVDVKYFYWDEWLWSLFMDFANSDIEVKTFAWTRKYYDNILKEKSKFYIKKRLEKWLGYKRIISKHNIDNNNQLENISEIKKNDELYRRKTAIVNDLDDIHADIDIYWPGKVSFLFFQNNIPNIIIINNQLIYSCLNSIFDCLWNQNYTE